MAEIKKTSRRHFLQNAGLGVCGLSALGLISGCGSGQPTAKAFREKPNIIFIMADDLGYGHLGCYGQKHIKTPCVDKMADEGMLFTQFYSGSTVCAPSRSVLITGQHSGHTTVRSNKSIGRERVPLRKEDVTVAEVLKEAGYRTGGFGKWGIGEAGTSGVPNKQGFDEWFGYLNQRRAHTYYPDYLWHNNRKYRIEENSGGRREVYSHELIMEHGLDFIRRNKDRPFFCYLGVAPPHFELAVPEKWVRPYRGQFPKLRTEGYLVCEDALATYAGMVSMLDHDAGRVMELVKELGIDDDTIVFFTSDNGPQAGNWRQIQYFFDGTGPLRGYKRDLYEGGIRVPMLVRWPGKVKAGSVSEHVWAFWDFMATASEIAGTQPCTMTDGLSVLPTLLGRRFRQKKHEYLYWECKGKQAIRMGDYKAVRQSPSEELELYNLKTDICESENLSVEHRDLVTRLEQQMKSARTPSPLFPLDWERRGQV